MNSSSSPAAGVAKAPDLQNRAALRALAVVVLISLVIAPFSFDVAAIALVALGLNGALFAGVRSANTTIAQNGQALANHYRVNFLESPYDVRGLPHRVSFTSADNSRLLSGVTVHEGNRLVLNVVQSGGGLVEYRP